MMRFWFGRQFTAARDQRARTRKVPAQLENLETRNLLTGGTVVQSGVFVYVTPTSTGPNTAIVSYQNVNGTTMLDVNLNGTNNYYGTSQVGFVYYEGSGASGSQTFENLTSAFSVGYGGSGTNLFMGGTRSDEFFGGSGSNTLDAGTGDDELIGGTGTNVFNENAAGYGVIAPEGTQNTINPPPTGGGNYRIL